MTAASKPVAAVPRELSLDEAQALVEGAEHTGQVVAALQDQPRRRDHAIGALAPGELRRLLDAVERTFRAPPEHREHRLLAERIDGVIAPLAARDLASIDI